MAEHRRYNDMTNNNDSSTPASEINAAHHLHETAFVVGQPWHDTGTFVVLGDEDPHLARFLCDTDSDLWDCPGDGRETDQRHAEEIARRWNDVATMRKALTRIYEVWADAWESRCQEEDTGACYSDDPCPSCERHAKAWEALPDLMGAGETVANRDDYTDAEYQQAAEVFNG